MTLAVSTPSVMTTTARRGRLRPTSGLAACAMAS